MKGAVQIKLLCLAKSLEALKSRCEGHDQGKHCLNRVFCERACVHMCVRLSFPVMLLACAFMRQQLKSLYSNFSSNLMIRCDTMLTCTILNDNFIFSPSLSLFYAPPLTRLPPCCLKTTDHLGIEFMGKEPLLLSHPHESRLSTSQVFVLEQQRAV